MAGEYAWEIYALLFAVLVVYSLLEALPASPSEAIAKAGPHNVAIGLFVVISVTRRRMRRIRHSICGSAGRLKSKETSFAGLTMGSICLGFVLLLALVVTIEFGFDAKAATALALCVPCILTIVLSARHWRKAVRAGDRPPPAPGSWRGIYLAEEACASAGLVALVGAIWAETAPSTRISGFTAAYFLIALAVAVALDLNARRREACNTNGK
jgi:hypothetical protein